MSTWVFHRYFLFSAGAVSVFLRSDFHINECNMKPLKNVRWYDKVPDYAVPKKKNANTIIRC